MFKRHAGMLLVTGLVLAGGAAVWAEGSPERPTFAGQEAPGGTEAPRPKAKARLQQRHKPQRPFDGYLGRAVHGDLIVREKDGDFETVTIDRGKVNEATTATRIVLDRPDGVQVSFDITEATRYKGIGGADQIRKGEPAMVTSKDGKALAVAQRQPGETRPGNPES